MKKIYSCRRYLPKEDIRDECDQCKVSSVNADMPRGNLSFDQLIQIARNITGTGKFWLVFVIVAGIWLLGGLAFVNHFTGLGIQDEINRRFDAKHIRDIIEKTAEEQAVKRIDETADTVIEEKIRTQIAPRLAHSDSIFSEFQLLTDFYGIILRIEGDDRIAFDMLMKISWDSSDSLFHQYRQFRDVARGILNHIPVKVASLRSLSASVDWGLYNVNLDTADMRTFTFFIEEIKSQQKEIVETVWGIQRFSKKERIQFLIDTIKNTSSLRCLDKACHILSKESKIDENFISWKKYLEWWEANKDKYE